MAENCFELDPAIASAMVASLTNREREVAKKISMGTRTAAIASELGISPKTVDIHRIRIKTKFGELGIARVWFCAHAKA